MTDVTILGVKVRAQRYDDAIAELVEAASGPEPHRAHFCTVHTLVEAQRRPDLRAAYASSWMVCMDGVPLSWVARMRGVPAQRVCGPDVLLSLCDQGRAAGLRHYFLGGAPGVADDLAKSLNHRFPGLVVAGVGSPPFRELTDAEDQAFVDAINAVEPNIVWVGLGSPKQEIWAAEHQNRLRAGLILPVGAAFDFHSGRVRRAPSWMRRAGLEWLFRLAMEPRRLFRRYVVTNAQFLALIAREELSRRLGRADR